LRPPARRELIGGYAVTMNRSGASISPRSVILVLNLVGGVQSE
jgi:hypothetical protein